MRPRRGDRVMARWPRTAILHTFRSNKRRTSERRSRRERLLGRKPWAKRPSAPPRRADHQSAADCQPVAMALRATKGDENPGRELSTSLGRAGRGGQPQTRGSALLSEVFDRAPQVPQNQCDGRFLGSTRADRRRRSWNGKLRRPSATRIGRRIGRATGLEAYRTWNFQRV
jgi:hypothetical protein